jgi:hypothetical protein
VIVVLLNVYLVLLFLLVKLHIVRFNLFWKISPVIVFLLLLIGLFIPMGWGAPQGDRSTGCGQCSAEGGRRAVPYRSSPL